MTCISFVHHQVAIIWRKDEKRLQYDWLEEGWHAAGPGLQKSSQRLGDAVQLVLRTSDVLPFHMVMTAELQNENLAALWKRVLQRIGEWLDLAWDKVLRFGYIKLYVCPIANLCSYTVALLKGESLECIQLSLS